LTPGGIFPHSSILEANVRVSTVDVTLTEIEKKTKQQHVLVKCVQRNLDRKLFIYELIVGHEALSVKNSDFRRS